MIDNLGHLNLIWATQICQSLARMGHQLSKLNDTPELPPANEVWLKVMFSEVFANDSVHRGEGSLYDVTFWGLCPWSHVKVAEFPKLALKHGIT